MRSELVRYIAKRLLQAVVTFWGIITITFIFVGLVDVNPMQMQQGGLSQAVDQRAIEAFKRQYHLDKPIPVRYALWLANVVRFDFGVSTHDDRPVVEKIAEALPITLALGVASIAIAFIISVATGIYTAMRHNGALDRILGVVMLTLYALPVPLVALSLIALFGVEWKLLPFYGLVSPSYDYLSVAGKIGDLASHLALPLVCYTYGSFAFMSRLTKGAMLDTLSEDYVKTARSKGIREIRVVIRHAFRNSLIPVVTMLSTALPGLVGGSVIIEKTFSIPGMGLLMFDAVRMFDYPTLMAGVMFSAFLTLANILIVDFSYVLINPRIVYGNA